MRPPVILAQRHGPAGNSQYAARPSGLVEARDILYDAAVALAEIVFLFVRIHPRAPNDVEADARRVVGEQHPKALEALDWFDRKRTDFDLVRFWTKRARSAKVILLALIPDRGEPVLHILIGILADAATDNHVLVGNVIQAEIDALGPLRAVGKDVVQGGGKL